MFQVKVFTQVLLFRWRSLGSGFSCTRGNDLGRSGGSAVEMYNTGTDAGNDVSSSQVFSFCVARCFFIVFCVVVTLHSCYTEDAKDNGRASG